MNVELPDLISRAAAIEAIYNSMRYGEGYKAVCARAIERIPAVDAVTVVRCKDCEYWIPGPDGDIQWGVCERHKSIFTVMNTPGDYYCADGERKG